MIQSQLVLTVDDQARMMQRVLKAVYRARSDMPPAPQSVPPVEALEFLLTHYAISRVEADRARTSLRQAMSQAEPLIAALDIALDDRFELAARIRGERDARG
jgi:hypothetical protein